MWLLIGVLGLVGAGCTAAEPAPGDLQMLGVGSSNGAGGTNEHPAVSDGGGGVVFASGGSAGSGSAGGTPGGLSGSGGLTGNASDVSGSDGSTDSPGVVSSGGSSGGSFGSPVGTGYDAGSGSDQEAAFGGTPAAIPGTVQVENYDTGGAGVAYHIKSMNGTANAYRSDGVNLEDATDVDGNLAVGWTSAGIWFRYTVKVATSGTYTVSFRVAADSAVGAQAGTLHLQTPFGINLSGAVNVPGTGGWKAWTTVSASVTLAAGQQVLELFEDTGGYNINYMTFASE